MTGHFGVKRVSNAVCRAGSEVRSEAQTHGGDAFSFMCVYVTDSACRRTVLVPQRATKKRVSSLFWLKYEREKL